ncbi:MAG: isopentenyl phosphate kinase family protein [Anaerolineales bacterium]|nr:isopentenyl phosphate kinase family protein [Anaerolineales bacterium]
MIFLKLGGSLITDKLRSETPQMEIIERIASEIAAARETDPELKLLLGHGSGSYGHPVAKKYGTQNGAETLQDWVGFSEVWYMAHKLDRIIIDSLRSVGLPAISFAPSASSVSSKGQIVKLMVEPIKRALDVGLLPVVQGDVAFDQEQGSTILSTEMVFRFLAPLLMPTSVLLAGIEPGVFKEYPSRGEIIGEIMDGDVDRLKLGPSTAPDVTGGMGSKVREAMSISRAVPGMDVRIFSGKGPNSVYDALLGEPVGTLVRALEVSP